MRTYAITLEKTRVLRQQEIAAQRVTESIVAISRERVLGRLWAQLTLCNYFWRE